MPEVTFYKHDSYIEIRRKFTGAWSNLRLEIQTLSERFWKGEDDEIEDDFRFFPPETLNDPLLTLDDEMTKAAARGLFTEKYGQKWVVGYNIEAFIYGNFAEQIVYPPETHTLKDCNDPFILPFNKFSYAEFKRRFNERWTNLSIAIYQKEDSTDELTEMRDDFEMNNLTNVNRLVSKDYLERNGVRNLIEKCANEMVLSDEVYLSDLTNALEKKNVFFRVKNEKLGVYWDSNSIYNKLIEFQAAEFSIDK